jgi:MoxR-like ATPase
VLFEGLPGLGKTEHVKALSRLLSHDFRRIQFTPDRRRVQHARAAQSAAARSGIER